MTRARRWPVTLLAALALGARLGYVLLYPQLPLQADARDYDRLARSIANGNGFIDANGQPETLRAPLYPLFVAVLYRLGGDTVSVRVVQAVLGAMVPLVVLQLGRACFTTSVA